MVVKICNTSYPVNTSYESYFQHYPYPLSDFQKYAIEAIVEKHHVLVTAHTGSGKTLPAEFAIEHLVRQGKKVIYTSPIKALSNQKFSEFSRKYPDISFGLLTGDIKTNPEADVLIMTTEILMNYLFVQTTSDKSAVNDCQLQFQIDLEKELACVVFDEVHYINDADRGQTWEKTILMLPYHVQMILLSATIDAPERFAQWIQRDDTTKDVYLASTNKRVVPLTHYAYMSVNDGQLKTFTDKVMVKDIRDNTNKLICIQSDKNVFQEDGYKTLKRIHKTCNDKKLTIKRKQVLNNVCKMLHAKEMTPAICFVFSRKLVEVCASEITVPLLEDDSKVSYTVARECEQIVRRLPNFKEYMELPEYVQLVSLLEKGIGIHHSGMIPILREIVEIMISKKYIKLLFATESFAIGLDCPIKTAMFASLTKYDGHYDRFLMGHEYTQMAGRAGRRGIDTIGHVVHLNNLFSVPMQPDYMSILKGKPQALVSKFRISYSLLLSLLKNGKNSFDDFRHFVSNSMAQNETASAIENQRATIVNGKEQINHLEEKMRSFSKDVTERYCTLQTELQDLGLSKKKRRKFEDEMERFGKEHREFASSLANLETQKTQTQKDEDVLLDLEQYIDESIRRVCNVLIDKGFVEIEGEEFRLTKSGSIASSIAEVHPLIMTTLMKQNNMFEDIDSHQLIGLFACFTNVNVNKECKRLFPHSDDEFLKQIICNTSEWMTEYEDLENMQGIQSGIDYQDALNFDMPDLSITWANCDNETECKSFVQQIGYEKGISIGDFTKAMMKISTISRELGVIAEMEGHIGLLHKLKEIDGVLLKYITTSQSLYV